VGWACGAEDRGEGTQVDTDVTMGRHRLKLREVSDGEALLIGYSRPDAPEARRSQYRMAPVKAARSVKSLLSRQWGVKAVVRKTRRWFVFGGHVRIHVDHVHGLGDYLEFEAVLDEDGDYDEASARLDVARLTHDFGLCAADLVATSYANLMLATTATPSGT
jgi:adenylate cyclase class IV